jgi:hypothetical protein
MTIAEEVNLILAVLHKGFSVGAFYGRLLSGGYRVEWSGQCRRSFLPTVSAVAPFVPVRLREPL